MLLLKAVQVLHARRNEHPDCLPLSPSDEDKMARAKARASPRSGRRQNSSRTPPRESDEGGRVAPAKTGQPDFFFSSVAPSPRLN